MSRNELQGEWKNEIGDTENVNDLLNGVTITGIIFEPSSRIAER